MNESADKELKGYTHTKVTIRLTFDMNTLEFQSEKSETTARTHTHTHFLYPIHLFSPIYAFLSIFGHSEKLSILHSIHAARGMLYSKGEKKKKHR